LRAKAPELAVQASGGVRHLVDVRAAQVTGCAGIVLGRSLLEGHLELADAIACR
jgi:phosphoribosylformimino-5-aminoimidazole carboxamide ribotide isomerase